MRLSDQLRVLREAAAVLAVERSVAPAPQIDGNQANTLQGVPAANLRRVLQKIRAIPALAKVAGSLLALHSVKTAADGGFPAAPTGTNEINGLQAQLNVLLGQVRLLIAGLEPLAPDEPDHLLAVTVPPDVTDLTSFERFIADVQEAIEQPGLLIVGEKPSLDGVDRGSMVLLLAVPLAVFGLTRVLIAACERALREKERGLATQKHLESLGLLNDELVQSMVATQRGYRASLAQEIDDGYLGHHPAGHNAHEVQARLLKSMELLIGLVERGTKLQLQAADESKEAPGIEEKILERLPEFATKLLTAKATLPDAS